MSKSMPASAKLDKSEKPAIDPPVPRKGGRLMTFRPPRPSPALISALAPVNRWLCLGGIPGLRALPLLGSIPGIRGLMNITEIDFPDADQQRLRQAAAPGNAVFITPNHPEFFTDWMLDKEVLSRAAPLAACWATHDVVNGMGKLAQAFWLKNNLVAQIPGAGGKAGKAYSIDWALKGNGVLLHPEGSVGWHGDMIGPLFAGAADMALQAAAHIAAKHGSRKVFIAPVVWKLKFTRDAGKALHEEMNYVEKTLQLPLTRKGAGLANRLYEAYDGLLARDETKWGQHPTTAPYFGRHGALMERLLAKLEARLEARLDRLGAAPANGDVVGRIRRGERWLRGVDKSTEEAQDIRELVQDLLRARRFRPQFYSAATLTQEQIAESIKRLRNDYCTGAMRDMINKYLPQPAAPRIAHIRVPEPIEVGAMDAGPAADEIVEELRARMQAALDAINRDIEKAGESITEANPFAGSRG